MTYLNPGDLGRFKSLVTSLILATVGRLLSLPNTTPTPSDFQTTEP